MASSSSSPQERSIASPKLYDAFISHRGPDVKHTLAKQLYQLLKVRGCKAFLDREEIEGGDSIPSAIHNAICSSVVQIAIFSKRYAESSWCLDELLLMLQQTDALFIPVFCDVQPWELRHIDDDKSQYAAAFSDYQRKGRNLNKLDKWKKALASAADISGYELSQHQDNLCEKIVSRVLQVVQEKEKSIPLYVAKYPVGLTELVQDFERSCSRTARDKVTIVGIFGLGGVGKTTLAKELFNRKRSGYHASCFLSDVRESQARGELHCLQSQLLKDLFDQEQVIRNVGDGIARLEHCLGRARHLHFLIVLDDIDHRDQLDALLPEAMLSPGSLALITTRDQSVLMGAEIRYGMKEMNRDHAKNLFCSHAFCGRDPPTAYDKLVESFVEFCRCLPLSLKVLGAHVYGRDEHYWELELEKVKKIQPKDIMQRLKISFDGLDREEKQIFVDIACYLNKKGILDLKSKTITVWNASGWNAEHAVQTLQKKCLVEVGWDKFEMHDHLRDLGRQMADDLGSPRLWRSDILRSMEAKGFKQILAETKGRCFHSFRDSSLETKITYFIAETGLLWLEIDKYGGNLENIPSWIPLRKLRCFVANKVEEMWSTFQQQLQTNTQASFELRMLKIWDSPSLQKLPDLIEMFSHLEELEIESSFEKTDITSFVESLKHLSNLRSLVLSSGKGVFFSGNLDLSKGRDSTNLVSSTSSSMDSLETIRFGRLDNISKMLISGEVCPRLRSLEVQQMWNLNEMHLKQLEKLKKILVWGCPKLEAISGFSLTGLQSLTVEDCPKVETIAGLSSLTGLRFLEVRRCPSLETISGLSSLTGLQVLEAEECEGLKSLPTVGHLRHLERVTISKCHQLQSAEGVKELPALESLVIEVPDDGYAWVRNCINGLRRLPLKKTILIQKPMDKALSKLKINLFSEVIGVQAVVEIKKGEDELEMRSSSNAITIYALFVRSFNDFACNITFESRVTYAFPHKSKWMIMVLLTQHDSKGNLRGMRISKGFKVTVNVGKALTVLQTIFEQLYGQMVPKLGDDMLNRLTSIDF